MEELDAMLITVSQAEAEEDLSEDKECEQALAAAAIIGRSWDCTRNMDCETASPSSLPVQATATPKPLHKYAIMGRNERCDTIEWEPWISSKSMSYLQVSSQPCLGTCALV